MRPWRGRSGMLSNGYDWRVDPFSPSFSRKNNDIPHPEKTRLDSLNAALSTPGLGWLFFAATLAGFVRGFAGFGTAMVFMPIAAQVISPVWALVVMVVMDVVGPLPNVKRCLRDGHPRDVLRLGFGMLVMLPLGIFALSLMSEVTFRTIVSGLALILLILLVSGYRYSSPLSKPLIYGVGGLGGFLGGASGLAGPPVIMLYMASKHPAQVIRANIMLFLVLTDFAMLALFWLWGMLSLAPLVLGLLMTVPYLLANVAGAAIFDPKRETIYRRAAYTIIAASAISGLPFWD